MASGFSEQQAAAESAEGEVRRREGTWRCCKCGHHEADVGEARQSGSLLGSVFDVEGLRFTTVSCRRCGYTEFYKGDAGMLGNLLDLGLT